MGYKKYREENTESYRKTISKAMGYRTEKKEIKKTDSKLIKVDMERKF